MDANTSQNTPVELNWDLQKSSRATRVGKKTWWRRIKAKYEMVKLYFGLCFGGKNLRFSFTSRFHDKECKKQDAEVHFEAFYWAVKEEVQGQ